MLWFLVYILFFLYFSSPFFQSVSTHQLVEVLLGWLSLLSLIMTWTMEGMLVMYVGWCGLGKVPCAQWPIPFPDWVVCVWCCVWLLCAVSWFSCSTLLPCLVLCCVAWLWCCVKVICDDVDRWLLMVLCIAHVVVLLSGSLFGWICI